MPQGYSTGQRPQISRRRAGSDLVQDLVGHDAHEKLRGHADLAAAPQRQAALAALASHPIDLERRAIRKQGDLRTRGRRSAEQHGGEHGLPHQLIVTVTLLAMLLAVVAVTVTVLGTSFFE